MKLILLRCPNCSEPLKPENDDLVLACSNCHTPVAIATNGPVKMRVQYAVPERFKLGNSQRWVPFWVFQGRVRIQKRETQGRSKKDRKSSEALWGIQRHLYVPAWDLDMQMAQDVGSKMIKDQPKFSFVDQPDEVRLVPVTVKPKDAEKLLEFIVLAIEARRRDWLKDLKFQLDAGEPELWALPENSYR